MTEHSRLPPFVPLSRNDKRATLALGPQVRGATIRLDTPIGFYAGLLVAAHRVGFRPLAGDTVQLARTEDIDAPYPPGWVLQLVPRRSPANGPEHVWSEPWAAERVDHIEGLFRILDPSVRPALPADPVGLS